MLYPYTETLVSAKDMLEGQDYLFAGNNPLITEKAIDRFKDHPWLYFRRGTRIFGEREGIISDVTMFTHDDDKFLALEILNRFERRTERKG
jgi:hypothetical protein